MTALNDKPLANKGAFIFYESSVTFTGCDFSNIKQENALQIIRSDYTINHCLFQNIQSTGLLVMFSNGTISNSAFENCRDAAIEATMGMITLNTITASNINRGLYLKGGAQVKGKDVHVKLASVALSVEDGSTVELSNTLIRNSGTAIASRNKKAEHAAVVKMLGLQTMEVKRNYQIENQSLIIVNGVEVKDDRKIQMDDGN
jgi:hypothetical protein